MMFVSLLQMMGFSAAKPVHSRAEEKPPTDEPKAANDAVHSPTIASKTKKTQVKPARRPTVKAQPAKLEDSAKKPVAAVRPLKEAIKGASKATANPPVPADKKAATAKQAQGLHPAKPADAPVVAKPITPTLKKKPEEVTKKTQVESVAVASKAVPAPAVVKAAATAPQLTPLGVPVRSGRPSSRLAQLTVPSMAQSVASTAAKSSFTQISTPIPITPVAATSVKRDPTLANNWKSKPVADLSDAEVVAMPDEVYMNDTQMAFFRLKLVRLKEDILSNAGETTEHLREDTAVVPDPADRATIEEEHALELRTRDRERKLLKKIEQSINRIDAGDYGYCDETGEPIGVGRLLARPTATLSLEAQQRRELKQKMFGD
jgi:DnaK suppressor protein